MVIPAKPEKLRKRSCTVVSDSRQQPLFAVRQFVTRPYKPLSFFGLLEQYGELIIHRADFPTGGGLEGGAPAWCPVLLTKLLLLQAKHGWSDDETVRRAEMDLQVKACVGLGVSDKGPSQPVLSRHRQVVQKGGLAEVYMQRFQELVIALELLRESDPVAVDSVPMHGAGQVLDTFNLLGAWLCKGLSLLAEQVGLPREECAARYGLERYLERSPKGRFEADWSNAGQQRQVLSTLVEDSLRLKALLASEVAPPAPAPDPAEKPDADDPDDAVPGDTGAGAADPGSATPPPAGGPKAPDSRHAGAVAALDATLDAILAHDIARDDAGQVTGVQQKAAGDRIISITDPDMRHGRKSASVLIAGYKVQVVAALTYGWILMCKVIRANRHDGDGLPQMVRELQASGLAPAWIAGDHAYGTIENHKAFAEPGMPTLIARMSRPDNHGLFSKDEFGIDFESRTLTCPAGHTCSMRWENRGSQRGWLFAFPGDLCGSCPLRSQCVRSTDAAKGRTVWMEETAERHIRRHLSERQDADFRAKLAQRVRVEHALAGFAQCGGKLARRFGESNVAMDATLSALAYNMRRLAAVLSADAEARRRLEAVAAERRRALIILLMLAFAAHLASQVRWRRGSTERHRTL